MTLKILIETVRAPVGFSVDMDSFPVLTRQEEEEGEKSLEKCPQILRPEVVHFSFYPLLFQSASEIFHLFACNLLVTTQI